METNFYDFQGGAIVQNEGVIEHIVCNDFQGRSYCPGAGSSHGI